jgi:hypothetical protein
MLFLLGCLICGSGVISFILLKSSEASNFDYMFESSVHQLSVSINRKLHENLLAGEISRNLYTYAINAGAIGTIPNITLLGYDDVMNPLSDLASTRRITFSPIVTKNNRDKWESYARQHIDDLNGPSDLKISINNSWTINDGMYERLSNGKNIRSSGYSPTSVYPDILTPIWQITNISINYESIMYDTHSDKVRMIGIDNAITTKLHTYTDLVQLIIDKKTIRPSTILFEPIISKQDNNVIGIIAIMSTWDNILQDVLPSFVSGFHCVLSTSTQTYTYLLSHGQVQLLGSGDVHDPMYNKYVQFITLRDLSSSSSSNLKYTLKIYPTKELYNKYNTNIPTIVSCVLVASFLILFSIIFIMNKQKRKYEDLIEKKRIKTFITMVII